MSINHAKNLSDFVKSIWNKIFHHQTITLYIICSNVSGDSNLAVWQMFTNLLCITLLQVLGLNLHMTLTPLTPQCYNKIFGKYCIVERLGRGKI